MAKLAFTIDADYQKVIKLREEIDRLKSTLSGMDGNTSPGSLRAMETQLAQNTKEFDRLVVAAAKTGHELEANLKKKIFEASQSVNTFSDKIIDQRVVVREVEADVKNLASSYAKLGKLDPSRGKLLTELNAARTSLNEEKATLFGLQQEQSKSRLSVKRLRDEYALYNNEGKDVQSTNSGMSVSFGKVLGVIGGVSVLKELASEITSVTGQFQRFENVLTNALGGDNNKAKTYLGDIEDFAAKTNFQLDELTDNFLKFVNRGVTPTMDSMTKLGDFTNSVSKPYAQLSEAILDINNPERWKEFGVQVQTNGSKVNLTFRGMKIEADRTVESVMNAIEQFGSMDGIKGSTEAIAGTIEGQMSNLKDTITSALNEIGQANSDIISGGISTTSTLIENYDKVGRVLVGLVATYGAYRTAVMLATAAEGGHSVAMLLIRERILLARKAQQLLNATMLSNPYVAVTALVVGLVAGMWALSESTTAAEKAQKKFSDRMQGIEDDDKKRKEQVDKLIAVIQDETAVEIERYKAIQELRKIVPEATKDMSDEAIKTDELTSQKKKYNEELSIQIGLEKQRELNQLYAQKKSLENSIKTDRGTKGYKYQYRADQDQLILNEVDKQIAKLEKEKSDFFKLKKRSNQTVSTSSISKEIADTTTNIAKLKQELSDLRSGKTSVEAGKTVKEVIEGKVKDLKAAEDALSTLTGKDSATDKKSSDEQKKVLEARKKLSEELLSLRMQNQQAEINLMEEGRKKRLAQIEFDYDSEIAVVLAKEKEWKEAQNGKLTEDQTKEIHVSFFNSYVKKEKSTAAIDKDQLEAEKQAMNEYLAAYGDYQEKRKAIAEKYNDLIVKATTQGEKLSLKKQLDEELKSIDLSEFKKSINFAEVFGNLDNLTPDSITRLRDKLKEYINKAASGLQPEDLKELSDALSNIEIKAAEKNPFGEIGKSLDDYKNATNGVEDAQEKLNYVMAGGEILTGLYEDGTGKLCKKLLTQEQAENNLVKAQNKRAETLERLNTSLAAGVAKASEYLEIAVAMTEALEDFGVEVPKQLTGFIDGMGKTLDSLALIDLTKPLSVIKGTIGAIGGIGKAIGSLFNNDKGKEKNIQRLQDQIETLDKSYDMLGDSIEKAYSKDASNLINDQNKLLEQQKVLINQQIREEEDKKKTDDDRIKEWREQLEEIDKTLADNKKKAVDAIFGEDLKSAIDNFAQAYADAWASNTDKAQSAKDTVKKMMRQMVTESIKAAIESSKSMETIRAKLEEFYADNVLSGWEQDYIYNMAENLQKELDSQFGWADSLMKDEKDKEFDLGISSDSIADTIAEGLADGKSGFKDFAGSFEDMMRTAVINSLKTKYLEGPLKEFSKKFSELSESGGQLTEAEIEELRDMYADIIDGAKAQFDSMKDIAGLDFSVDSDNSLKGAFAKADQESITLLAGQTGASRKIQEEILNNMQPIREQMQFIRDLQVKGWEDVKIIRELTVKIDKNTEQVAENTRQIKEVADKVADNTRNTVDALEGTINVKIKGM